MKNFEPGQTINSHKIPYLEIGNQAHLLHFAHANGYPPGAYLPLFESLSTRYHIIAMEQRPLWPTSAPDQIRDWRPLAQDMARFLSQNNPNKKLVGAGHSMGATTTLRLALQNPELFSALILVDPVIFLPWVTIALQMANKLGIKLKIHHLAASTLRRRKLFDNQEIMYNHYRSKPVFRRMSDESLWAYVRSVNRPVAETQGMVELRYSPEWEAKIYLTGNLADLELWRNLRKLQLPTLVIRGQETDTFLVSTARRMQKIASQIQIVNIPETGHLAPLEKPQLVAQIILEFLDAETKL